MALCWSPRGAATGRDGRCADQISGQPRRPDAFFYVSLVARDVWYYLGGVAMVALPEAAALPAAGAACAPQPHALCPLKCVYDWGDGSISVDW
jgi:hypothetical protein